MNKPKLHIYGKYMGDIKVIHDVLEESNEYVLTYQYIDTGNGSRPSNVDYLIISHQTPDWYKGKIIHAYHGLGCLTSPRRRSPVQLLTEYRKQNYYALCTYGKVHKSWFVEGMGFPSKRILVIGMASSIELLSPMNLRERKEFLHKKGLDPTKKTIMYAPTWGHNEERGFFCLWWQDGREEERVRKFCKFATRVLNMNLVVRLHEKKRYSQDWIKKYRSIFDTYKVSTHFFDQDPYNLPYFKFSDFLVGDLSSVNTYFYVMDKPVIHIGTYPFKKKLQTMWASMALSERAGYVVEDFQDLLAKVKDSVVNPAKFSVERKKIVDKYIDHVGEDSRKAILSEFRRFLYNDREKNGGLK